jgi:hypothetical protein
MRRLARRLHPVSTGRGGPESSLFHLSAAMRMTASVGYASGLLNS